MKFAYTFTLCRRAVVVTCDLSARNLHLFKVYHWLSDPRNVVQLRLESPAWDTGVAGDDSTSEPHGADAIVDRG